LDDPPNAMDGEAPQKQTTFYINIDDPQQLSYDEAELFTPCFPHVLVLRQLYTFYEEW
jgi:hypothetical protein